MPGPLFKYGDMFMEFNKPRTTFLVTTNGIVNRGRLVMGAGAAKQLKLRWPRLDKVFGDALNEGKNIYGLRVCDRGELQRVLGAYATVLCSVGAFQVKEHYRDNADPGLINTAVKMLAAYAAKNPHEQIHLNMPGTGYGRLSEATVVPLLQQLPSNVSVWRFGFEKRGF